MLNIFFAWLRATGPHWTYSRVWLHALLTAIGLTGLTWFACSALGMAPLKPFAENAIHELLQSVVLGCALLASVAAVARCSGLDRYAAGVTGLVSYVGFFREMPSCRGDVAVFCAASETRGSFMAVGAVLLLLATIAFEARNRGMIVKAIHPRLSWPLALAAGLVGASQLFESLHMVALEETLELYSFLILMFSSVWLASRQVPLSRLASPGRWR